MSASRSRLVQWIDRRLPIFTFLNRELNEYPTPRNLNYWWNFGSIAGFMLLMMILTGVTLAMHYDPDASSAFGSVEHIMRDVNYGWLFRYLHSTGASMFFLVIYLHLFRSLYYGSYKTPREILWILGVVILLLMMATAFFGYTLPWGQMSFWGATVITNLFSAIPLIDSSMVEWLQGGYAIGNPTLHRFYALHYLLPFIIVAVVFLHLWALHHNGSNNPLGIDLKSEAEKVPFHPYYTAKDMLGLSVFLLVYLYFVFFAPGYLLAPENSIPADPMTTPAHIVPEWYLLPFYAILRAIPNKLMGVVAMFGSILVLFFVPWLDTSRVRSARFRPLYKYCFWLLVISSLVLGYCGSKPPEGAYVVVARIAAIYYFTHFLVALPVLGLIETPDPLPITLGDQGIVKKA